MPITKVQVPDGRIVEVEHPDGASEEQILRFAKQSLPTQEEVRAKRLAGVPVDAEEESIQQQQLLKQDQGFFEGVLTGMGAEFQNLGINLQRLFGVEGAEAKAQEQAKLQEILKQTQPSAVFGKPAAIASTAPLAAGASTALAARLGGGLLSNLAGGAVVGGAEGAAFSDLDSDPVTSGLEGAAFGVAGEAGGAIIKRGLQRLAQRSARGAREGLGGIPEDGLQESVEEGLGAVQDAQKAGIDLTPAQATGERLKEQNFLLSHSATSKQATKFLARQNDQALDALNKVINDIAPEESVQNFAANARRTANLALESAKEQRRTLTQPLYKQAFSLAKGTPIDISQVTNGLVEEAAQYPQTGSIRKVLNQARDLFLEGGDSLTDLEKIHKARVELGELINTRKDGGLGPVAKRLLIQTKSGLDEVLEEASPAYLKANQAYAEASQPVTELAEGVIGRIANYSDEQLSLIGGKLLDPQNVSASNVQNIKKVFESVPGGDIAWREVVRGELQKRVGKVNINLDDPSSGNVPQQLLSKVFGNPQQSQTLFRAVDDKARENLKLLRRVLEKAAKGRNLGSPTASNQEILREARTGFAKGLNVVSSPKATFDDFVSSLGTTDNLKALANNIFSPVVEDHLVAIRQALTKQQKIPTETINSLTKYLSTTGATQVGNEGETANGI